MVEVVRRKRKSPILTPSKIPCLRRFPTINITQGCALGCVYCYIQGYSNYPGLDRIVLYENTPEIAEAELSRKRRKPRRVYFSPSSDVFQHLPEVQEVSFRTVAVLLEAGVEVSFLTKGFVTDRFIRLFAATPHMVFAQVGITTLDEHLWKHMEPWAAPPQKRLEYLHALTQIGVRTTARLDPLIPDVTDTPANLAPLLESLRDAGVTQAPASYLFLRPGLAKHMSSLLAHAYPTRREVDAWQYQSFLDRSGGGKMIETDERCRRFARLQALGNAAGIQIVPCRCKNPDLGGGDCGIAGPSYRENDDLAAQGVLDFAEKRRQH